MAAPAREAVWRRIPGAVWALGLTSLFMDTSSEAIHSILPLFITQLQIARNLRSVHRSRSLVL